jgi:hypothetical protein
MDDAPLMGGFESFSKLAADVERFVQRDAAPFQSFGQSLPLDELQDEEPLALVFSEPVDSCNVGMVQLGQELRLTLEARKPFGIQREEIRQGFDGDFSVQNRVFGAVDLSHAACAQQREDFVRVQSPPHQGAARRLGHGPGGHVHSGFLAEAAGLELR